MFHDTKLDWCLGIVLLNHFLDFFQELLFHENTIGITIQMEMIIFIIGCIKSHCLNVDPKSPSIVRLLQQLDKAIAEFSTYIVKLLHVTFCLMMYRKCTHWFCITGLSVGC